MAEHVYSERFLLTSTFGAWIYYTVPAGRRAVLRSVSITTAAPVGAIAAVALKGFNVVLRQFQATNVTENYDMRHVAYGGETMGAYASAKDVVVAMSGYLFVDTGARAEHPPAELEREWPIPGAAAAPAP